MLNVLVNAYAVSPTWGSEPGVGWNWVTHLARHCRVFVITEGEWREEIEAALEQLPQRANLRFYFNPVSPKVRRMCWNQGDWRFYWYYRQWQKRTLRLARDIIAQHRIDVIHQLNMIGFREPGYLWTIKDIPFVWGPIGGMELTPIKFLAGSTFKQSLKFRTKNLINRWQRRYQPRLLAALDKSSVTLAATKGVYDVLRKYHHADVILMNETGCDVILPITRPQRQDDGFFHILWVGRFLLSKQLGLALRVVAALPERARVRLHVVGKGTEEENATYRQIAQQLGLTENVVWHGSIPHDDVLNLMSRCQLFLFTSIMEGTPHVILEAVQSNLPIVCFDTCGQAGVVNSKVGVKIPMTTVSQGIRDFASTVERLMVQPECLETMRNNCYERQAELSWDGKARQMMDVYNHIVIKNEKTHNHGI